MWLWLVKRVIVETPPIVYPIDWCVSALLEDWPPGVFGPVGLSWLTASWRVKNSSWLSGRRDGWGSWLGGWVRCLALVLGIAQNTWAMTTVW
jgi:hypothetical protein